MKYLFVISTLLLLVSCEQKKPQTTEKMNDTIQATYQKGTFGYDFQFLKEHHSDAILLHDESNQAQVVVLPGYQGRVMTSTANGDTGASFGWINHDLIGIASTDTTRRHISAFGGEERFWMGPEGGQFSIYFKKGVPFTYENWFVPKEIDTEAFDLLSSSAMEAKFEKVMHLENYSSNVFDLRVNRNIRLLSPQQRDSILGVRVGNDVQSVAFESENTLTNTGTTAWTKKTGMFSIWILSMLNASEKTTVAIPYKTGDEKSLGTIVTDDYFGKVPADRLKVADGLIFFKADSKYRSKIGISPERAMPIVASYDAVNQVLTIATFTLPQKGEYVNSKWELQKDPFNGDAINSYNDGPVNGAQMGQVYELESSSPAAALAPMQKITHIHRTIHLKGPVDSLNKISQKILGVTVDKITL